MSEASRELARSIRRNAHDVANRKPGIRVAVVRKTNPLIAVLTDSKHKLTEDDLLFTQNVRRYDRKIGIAAGDGLIVTRLHNGDWIAHDVLSLADVKESSPAADVREFGAKGDGSTDDSAAFNSGIEAMAATGGTLLFPAGRFLVADVVLQSGVHLAGVGLGATILALPDGANTDVITSEGYGSASIVDFSITDLTIDGNKAHNSSGSGLKIDGSRFRIDGIQVYNCATDNINLQQTVDGVDTEGGMDSFITNTKSWLAGGRNIRIAGHDWHLTNVVAIAKDASHTLTNILIDTTGYATKMTNVHAWGECKYAMEIKSDVEAVNCEAEGAVTANVFLEGDNGLWLGGKVFVDESAHGKKGFKWATGKGYNWIINAVKVVGCTEGAFDFTLGDSGNSRISALVEQASGSVIVGTPSTSATIDLKVYGGASYTPPTSASNPVLIQTAETGTIALQTLKAAEAHSRFQLETSGQMGWGPGSTGADTFLQRNGAEVLRIIAKLSVSKDLEVEGKLGINGAGPQAKKKITGSRSTGTAMSSLITILQEIGIIGEDATTA
jgi:hypothetical protein